MGVIVAGEVLFSLLNAVKGKVGAGPQRTPGTGGASQPSMHTH